MTKVAKPKAPREGMILVNVLFIVAIAALVVMLMVTMQDVTIARTQRLREAAQASSYARAGEMSARVALRRDAREAPEADHAREAWGAVQEDNVAIAGGRFSLRIADAQGRFNINSLAGGNVVAEQRLGRILAVVGVPAELLAPIAAYLRFAGPVSDLQSLALVGVTPAQLTAMSELVVALPRDTGINLNAADERLLAILFNSPVAARLMTSVRDGRGYLTSADLESVNVITPPGTGFTSDFYEVEAEVFIGDTHQRFVSSLVRRRNADRVEVVAYGRRRTEAGSLGTPPRQ